MSVNLPHPLFACFAGPQPFRPRRRPSSLGLIDTSHLSGNVVAISDGGENVLLIHNAEISFTPSWDFKSAADLKIISDKLNAPPPIATTKSLRVKSDWLGVRERQETFEQEYMCIPPDLSLNSEHPHEH